jgi:thiamine monophosphate synthase
VLDSGAASVAVISDLLTDDPRARARAWVALIS